MKWESVVAGIAALGGLILVTKTPVVEREAETVVFNARALPNKIRIEEEEKEIKSPLLNQIVTDNSSYDFSFNNPLFVYPRGADGKIQEEKPIKIDFSDIANKFTLGCITKNTNGSLKGYSKAWCGNYMKQKEVWFASAAPVLKQMQEIGIDIGTSQFMKNYPYRSEGGKDGLINRLTNAPLPSFTWTKETLRSALTPIHQDKLEGLERIFIKREKINIEDLYPSDMWDNNISFKKHLYYLGRYIWDSLSETEQFEKELEYRLSLSPPLYQISHAFLGNLVLARPHEYERRVLVFGGYTDEQKRILMMYWMIAQHLAVHEGYKLWTKAWVDKGMDISKARIVTNIRGSNDLYTTGRGIPDRNKGVSSILSYDDLNTSFYSEKEITKIYLKNRNLFESTKRSMQAQIQPVLDANLGGSSSDSKQRLIDALTPPYFSNYEQAYFKNRPVKDVDDSSWFQIVNNITADVNKLKDSLSEQERKDLQAAWENRMQAGERKVEARINKATAKTIDDLNRAIVAKTQAGQKEIAKQKKVIEGRIAKMKEKLGL